MFISSNFCTSFSFSFLLLICLNKLNRELKTKINNYLFDRPINMVLEI